MKRWEQKTCFEKIILIYEKTILIYEKTNKHLTVTTKLVRDGADKLAIYIK